MHTNTRTGRRAVLGAVLAAALGVAAVTAALAPPAAARPDAGARAGVQCGGAGPGTIRNNRISIQLWNFATPLGIYPPPTTPPTQAQQQAALRGIFGSLRQIGYKSFENFAGTFGWTSAEYRRVFKSYDLRAVADHGDMNPATFDARLQSAHDLGLKYVGSGGWPTGTNMDTVAGALNMATVLNGLGRRAADRHLMVYGHNHWPEFATKLSYDVTGDGVPETVPALEVVIRNTDPRTVTFEIDVHWALEGLGYDRQPELLAFLRKYSSRISMLHVKGSDPNGGGPPRPDYAFERITDVGGPRDITDWKAVFRAATDVDYYHYEYDLAPDPIASAASAYRYLDCIRF